MGVLRAVLEPFFWALFLVTALVPLARHHPRSPSANLAMPAAPDRDQACSQSCDPMENSKLEMPTHLRLIRTCWDLSCEDESCMRFRAEERFCCLSSSACSSNCGNVKVFGIITHFLMGLFTGVQLPARRFFECILLQATRAALLLLMR